MSNTPGRKFFVIFWAITVTSFLFLSTWLVSAANGYVFNWRSLQFQKTSLILLSGNAENITLTVNGAGRAANLPQKLAELWPGTYEVEIAKEGYKSWQKIFQLQPGEAKTAHNITLYLNNIQPVKLEKDKINQVRTQNDFLSQNSDLEIKNNEIWYRQKLVTRFSEPVLAAVLSDDEAHIFFQMGAEIRVMELDGGNNVKLISLASAEKSAFVDRADKLFFTQGEDIFEAKIK